MTLFMVSRENEQKKVKLEELLRVYECKMKKKENKGYRDKMKIEGKNRRNGIEEVKIIVIKLNKLKIP